ncbi:bifunctional adenosylcobinamide kinase/adenosylcobinamide-phosphate guanylyltransferase [Paenibacillus doosanensis]|uniref:Adenosylcobinamide kinase n=1 Tax=Paenibacillus konkukensis TaxID=2020716 RepID=A0ABY4RTR5_9BACL|nr:MULTISPECIES: bifunctional adenosylcobinamide kinase/adenosylcobinamide-phosphate guanylyltransferase [Paenibacillus]MCS7460809.1 bifunctional adenosylcobinamide kinase/adenosylcobinamide-phosphate guanylyltransferase [Paenibacillus doosanensis]UQZ85989.1 Bifunctional adenosylcobalamin biosynthesis protein CobU [Paenibacillus konkukensis]
MLIVVTGGARSGKSSFAEAHAAGLAGKGVYVATAQAYDEEMKARIGLHRRQREAAGFPWTTVEESFELAELLLRRSGSEDMPDGRHPETSSRQEEPSACAQTRQLAACGSGPVADDSVILVDCLTLWLSNWLLRYEREPDAEERLQAKIDELVQSGLRYAGSERHLVLVTNEVGYGLVPEYKLGRQFRDLSGIMNQRLARVADQVFLVTAGIPLELKSLQYRPDK